MTSFSFARHNDKNIPLVEAVSVSIAIGTAMALQMNKKNNQIVVAGFGEAAADEGVFWESINYAGLKKLPIIFHKY